MLAVRSVATKLKTLNLTPIAAVASGRRAMGRANRNPGLRKQSRTKADEPALGRLSGLLIHKHPFKCDAQRRRLGIQHALNDGAFPSIEAESDVTRYYGVPDYAVPLCCSTNRV